MTDASEERGSAIAAPANSASFCAAYKDTCENRSENSNAATMPKLRSEVVTSLTSCIAQKDCSTVLSKDVVATCAEEAAAECARLQRVAIDDTDARAREVQLAVLRRLGPSGRVQMAAEMSEDIRKIALEAEQRRHPEWSAAEVRRIVLGRMWGQALADKVYDKIR